MRNKNSDSTPPPPLNGGDNHLERLTVLVTPDVALLLRTEQKRRFRDIGARFPLGSIIGELVRQKLGTPTGESINTLTS